MKVKQNMMRLLRVPCTEFESGGSLGLQQSHGSSELLSGLSVAHSLKLESHALKPGLFHNISTAMRQHITLLTWVDSTWRTMWASLRRMTGWSTRRLPKVFLLWAYLKASSTQTRARRVAWMITPKRSWLKLYMMYLKPWFSSPIKFSIGTFTSSKVTYLQRQRAKWSRSQLRIQVVPDGHTPEHCICLVVIPGIPRSRSNNDTYWHQTNNYTTYHNNKIHLPFRGHQCEQRQWKSQQKHHWWSTSSLRWRCSACRLVST